MALSFKSDGCSNFMGARGGACGRSLAQLLGVKSDAEGCFDARAKSLRVSETENSCIVDFGFKESSIIKISLCTNFKTDIARSALGIPNSFRASFDIFVDLVVI